MVVQQDNPMRGTNFSTKERNVAGEHSTRNDENVVPDMISVKSEPINLVEWKNTFHMRQMTLSGISSCSGQFRQTLSSQAAGTKLMGRYMTSASKSLELLRLNIQSLINKEIDAVLKKYLDKFFRPAIENIRNNLGENSVTDENIRIVCRQILEDAKAQYCSGSQPRDCSPYSDSEPGSFGDSRFGRTVPNIPSPVVNNKRKESEVDLETCQSVTKARKKTVRPPSNVISGAPAPLKVVKYDNARRQGPKWDPNRITKSTLFIMGARANKVLGFGQTRGRLYTKHPELLKYSGDAEDKEWLSRNNLMPPTGGIAYLLLLEDVKELAESDEYRHNPNILLHDLKGFEAPDFMLEKIRAFVTQARAEGNEQMNPTYFNDMNNSGTHINYNLNCGSVIMTPSTAVLGQSQGTQCEQLDFVNGTPNYVAPTNNDYLPSVGQNYTYNGVTYLDASRSNQPVIYPTATTVSSSVVNINNHPTLTTLLMSPVDIGDNPLRIVE